MHYVTPEAFPSTLGLDASQAGAIQIVDATLLRGDYSFSALVKEFSPDSEVRRIGDSEVYEVWPRIGAAALKTIINLTGSQIDTTRLQPDQPDYSPQKLEAFPGLVVAETHANAA